MSRQDFWSETSVQTLKALALSGLSASQIGAKIGFSRNAVIGKAARSGIKLGHKRKGDPSATPAVKRIVRPRVESTERSPSKRRRNYYKDVHPERRQRFHPPGPLPEPSDLKDKHYEAPLHTRKTLLELGPGHCRWPCGHPGEEAFFFCGDTQVKDRPYCPSHCSIAYQRTARQQAQYEEVAA